MITKTSFKKSCISAIRIGFCTALATGIGVGTVALLSANSPDVETQLAHVLKNLGPVGILFNWGMIPALTGFLITGILELSLWLQIKFKPENYASYTQRLTKILSHHQKIHHTEMHLCSIFAVINTSLNIYALGAEELDYKVGVPIASVVGMLFSSHGIPSKIGHLLVRTFQNILKQCCHRKAQLSMADVSNPVYQLSLPSFRENLSRRNSQNISQRSSQRIIQVMSPTEAT